MVQEGHTDVRPSEPAPMLDFLKVTLDAMKLLFVTCLQLKQAQSKVQSTVKQMRLWVNQMVLVAGHKQTDNTSARKHSKQDD